MEAVFSYIFDAFKESSVSSENNEQESSKYKTTLSSFYHVVSDVLNGEPIEEPDPLTQSVLSSYSLAAYLESVLPSEQDHLVQQLLSQVTTSINELFKCQDGCCFIHDDHLAGIVRLIQLQFLIRYPKYSSQGYEALYTCPPTIYISSLYNVTFGNAICRRLGLPASCLKVVNMLGDELKDLEKSLQEDLAAKRIPIMMIATLGSQHSGQSDNLSEVSKLSQRFNMWLHLEGHLLTLLTLAERPKLALQLPDSLHLDLKQWLGLPSLPFVTTFRHCEVALQRAANLTSSSCSPLNIIPLWFAVKNFDQKEIVEKLKAMFQLTDLVNKHLVTLSDIKIMSYVPREVEPVIEEEPVEMNSCLQILTANGSPVVVFQYEPSKKENEKPPTSMIDDLNLWLAQVLDRNSPEIHIDVLDVDQIGYCLKFNPLNYKILPSKETVEQFLGSLDQQLDILNATVKHKSTLVDIVNESEELELVELPGWAGLGGVRYLPTIWRSKSVDQLPDQGKEEINRANRQLVTRLKEVDAAFSLGESRDGIACIRFGMVVAETDVTALINLVRQTGNDVEASTQALETMAVMVRKGIEEAQAELQRETEQQLWEEGLLRHIPVVGSLVNYFSPPSQSNKIKGRTFNLQVGKIEPSDILVQIPAENETK